MIFCLMIKKIGGILVETEINKENIKTIIGIGINLNIDKEESWWGDLSKFALEGEEVIATGQISIKGVY